MTPFWIALTTTIVVIAGLLVLPIMISFTRKQIATRKPAQAPVGPATQTVAGAAPAPATKAPGYLRKIRGNMNPVTLFGVLVFIAIFIIFMLMPGDVVALIGTFLMGILGIMIITSFVMLVAGWGNRLIWFGLLVGFLYLSYYPPETTAQQVSTTTGTIAKGGLQTVTPDLVPDFIYMSPEEREAARKAEAKALEDELVLQAKVAGTERAAYYAEAAKNAPLTEAAFTTKTAGKFAPLHIKSGTRVGPIYLYAACNLRWNKTGSGMIKIFTRPLNSTDEPVEAKLTDTGYGIKKPGHKGLPADLFFEAVRGDIQIEMVRFDNGTNQDNPCK